MTSFLSNPIVISLIGSLVCTIILIFTVFKKTDNNQEFKLKKVLMTFGFIFVTILVINFINSGTKGNELSGGGLADVMKGHLSSKHELPILTDAFD